MIKLSDFIQTANDKGYNKVDRFEIDLIARDAEVEYIKDFELGLCVAEEDAPKLQRKIQEKFEPVWIAENPVSEPQVFNTGNEVMAVLSPSEIMGVVIEEIGIPALAEVLTNPMPGARLGSDTLNLVCSIKGWTYHGTCKRARTGYKCINEYSARLWDMCLHPSFYTPSELGIMK